jgi:hypothetical protein
VCGCVCSVFALSFVEVTALRQADHSSKQLLPSVKND